MSHASGPVQIQFPISVSNLFSQSTVRRSGKRRLQVQHDKSGAVMEVEVDRADTSEKVKKVLQEHLHVPTEHSDLCSGGQVIDGDLSGVRADSPLLLRTTGITRSGSSPCIQSVSAERNLTSKFCFKFVGDDDKSGEEVRHLIEEADRAALAGVPPVPATGGLGGAYFFRNTRGENIAIVKPTDEEPFAPNNPNGYTGRMLGQPGLKRSIRTGEAAYREVAAYLLDHERFSMVPYTAFVTARHSVFNVNGDPVSRAQDGPPTKFASFQQFAKHDFDASEHGTSRFPVAAVHRIGILDVRLYNTDRHSGNILVRRIHEDQTAGWERSARCVDDAVDLIPIDHGFCLPETLDAVYFEWLHWPQASLPFSSEELTYIAKLDIAKDVAILQATLPVLPRACRRILTLSTLLLKRAAALGFSLAEIGAIMSRELRGMNEDESELEIMCREAKHRLLLQIQMPAWSPRGRLSGDLPSWAVDHRNHVSNATYGSGDSTIYDGSSEGRPRSGSFFVRSERSLNGTTEEDESLVNDDDSVREHEQFHMEVDEDVLADEAPFLERSRLLEYLPDTEGALFSPQAATPPTCQSSSHSSTVTSMAASPIFAEDGPLYIHSLKLPEKRMMEGQDDEMESGGNNDEKAFNSPSVSSGIVPKEVAVGCNNGLPVPSHKLNRAPLPPTLTISFPAQKNHHLSRHGKHWLTHVPVSPIQRAPSIPQHIGFTSSFAGIVADDPAPSRAPFASRASAPALESMASKPADQSRWSGLTAASSRFVTPPSVTPMAAIYDEGSRVSGFSDVIEEGRSFFTNFDTSRLPTTSSEGDVLPRRGGTSDGLCLEQLEASFPCSGGILFDKMNEATWSVFLDALKGVLEEVLQEKRIQAQMKRFGTSCKF
eukprot:TRINITY_DN23249_c0_g1_i1.p1 TRINITY_DN23249_c0_g1~~TRINITY_DN23249_c0_g1_i1.p1  ORF type:complete len:883 (+),score=113.98 TRINITY_DN23249_c0_g1_i1:658-3306(+)